MSLTGRVALVTGSTGRGIGRSIALTLARDGAGLVLNNETRPERAETVRAAIEAMGRRAVVQQADVATEAGARALFDRAIADFGRVDILVLSAGGAWQPVDTSALDPAHWQRVLAEEVHAPLYLIPLVLPGMRERRWGRIILIGGDQAEDPPAGFPLDYALGKASRHWLARTLARREAAYGVTVNAIAPSETPYVELDEALADLTRPAPTPSAPRQTLRPQDVADAASYLCSEAASEVTGTIIEAVAG